MRKDTLIFVDREEEYLRSMTEFLGSQKDFPMSIRAYSDVLKMICEEDPTLRQTKEEPNPPYTMILVAESAYMEELERIAPENVVILQETDSPPQDLICIDKYRSAERVMKDIIRYYADRSAGSGRHTGRESELTVIGFFSPDEIQGKTCLAYAEAAQSALERSTLLMDMEMYATEESRRINEEETPDMGDLLYYLGEQPQKFRYHLKSLFISHMGYEVIQRMKLGVGLSDIPKEDWLNLLAKVEEADDHEVMILNLSSAMRGLPEIMRMCDRILIPGSADHMSICLENYIVELKELGFEDVVSKMTFCSAGNRKARL